MSFGLEKILQKYPQQFCQFSRVGDDFSYENKLITKKIILECSPHQY
jgi:hypothetical protein